MSFSQVAASYQYQVSSADDTEQSPAMIGDISSYRGERQSSQRLVAVLSGASSELPKEKSTEFKLAIWEWLFPRMNKIQKRLVKEPELEVMRLLISPFRAIAPLFHFHQAMYAIVCFYHLGFSKLLVDASEAFAQHGKQGLVEMRRPAEVETVRTAVADFRAKLRPVLDALDRPSEGKDQEVSIPVPPLCLVHPSHLVGGRRNQSRGFATQRG